MQTTRLNESHRATATARAVRLAGMFLVSKARQQARDTSVQQAAKNLRRQGVPLHVSLQILRGGV